MSPERLTVSKHLLKALDWKVSPVRQSYNGITMPFKWRFSFVWSSQRVYNIQCMMFKWIAFTFCMDKTYGTTIEIVWNNFILSFNLWFYEIFILNVMPFGQMPELFSILLKAYGMCTAILPDFQFSNMHISYFKLWNALRWFQSSFAHIFWGWNSEHRNAYVNTTHQTPFNYRMVFLQTFKFQIQNNFIHVQKILLRWINRGSYCITALEFHNFKFTLAFHQCWCCLVSE